MKKHIKIISTLFIALILVSCSGWLDLAPEDGVTRQEYWKTKEHVNSAVVGCYASLLNGPVEKMFLWGELKGDMLENGIYVDYDYATIFDGEVSSENSVVDWSSLYKVINNCNIVLRYAADVRKIDATFTEKQLKEYEAEALTLRAMMYFYLVRSFKDVPLALEGYVSDNQDFYLPKTSGDVILDTLVRDLKIASANAPINYSNNLKNKSRITAWSAKTLLADIYLWQEKYAECDALCNEIIGSNRYSMIHVEKLGYEVLENGVAIDTVFVANESDADKLFIDTYVNGASVETIFEIPFSTLKTNPFYALLAPDVNNLRPKIDNMDGTIFPEPQYIFASTATDIRGYGFSMRGSLCWKYVGVSRTGAPRTQINYTAPWIVYKYSDVLLMKAEAQNQIGLNTHDESAQIFYQKSINLLNTVRIARNAVVTDEYNFIKDQVDGKQLEKAIFDERAREFTYEGKRWYDVLRYSKRGNYEGNNLQYMINVAINGATPEKLLSVIAKLRDPRHNSHYWPIYIREIETNTNLTQNDFYAK